MAWMARARLGETKRLLTQLRQGQLVVTTANAWGPGKVVAMDDSTVTVGYFDSIGQAAPINTSVDLDSLRPFRAQPQTRCYWQVGGQWQVGRVVGQRDGLYVVRIANATDTEVEEADLHVRWRRPIADPTDVLVVHGNESAFFHNCRQPFVASLIAQRAACRGLTSLLSSVVQFYEHQVEIARRVLMDPIQRYLLADEVGLGKTIEAGLIIRQFLLDEPDAVILILAPDPLRIQWARELRSKFLLDDFDRATVKILGHDNWEQWSQYGAPGMLVVDEAHHLTHPVDVTGSPSQQYESLRRLAAQSSKLLLLSATPLLHNEASFLGMLHLIDPELHRFDQLEQFKSLVARRQELGRLFFTFQSKTPTFLLEETTARLREMFPEDRELLSLLDAVDAALNEEASSQPLENAVVAARVHISEAYRLHRRLLRTRRTEAVLDTYPVRGRKLPMGLIDTDPRRARVDLWLDAWRDHLVFEATRPTAPEGALSIASAVFWLFFEWAGSDVSQLRELGRSCVNEAWADGELGLKPADHQLLSDFRFTGESKALLEALLGELEAGEGIDRISQAVAFLLGRPPYGKTVVFSGFSRVAEQLALAISAAVDPSAVAVQLVGQDPSEVEEELDRFERNAFCRYLICDSSAEEGRNLQFADFLLHLDVPANPNRLEQRIGRIDRFSTAKPAEGAAFQDDPGMEPGYHSAWLACLIDGFGAFDQSISGMQYAVDGVMQEVRSRTVMGGAAAMGDCQQLIESALEDEAKAIAEQDALDAIEAVSSDTNLFDNLDGIENSWRDLKRAGEDWISDARGNLRFERTEDDNNREIVEFALSPTGKQPTLNNMPLVAWDVLAESFGKAVRRKGTFRREVALNAPSLRIFRLGEPFMDALAEFTQSDDRGRAFATWRFRREWRNETDYVALRFDYTVEGDPQPLQTVIARGHEGHQSSVARRRIDSFFPPKTLTIWLDVETREIIEERMLEVLSASYDPGKGDVNLSQPRAWVLDHVIGRDVWESLLRRAREESQRLLETRLDLTSATQAAQFEAKRHSQVTLEQLRVRLRAENSGGLVMSDPDELAVESELAVATLEGVSNPIIGLDSLGVVILSGRLPVGPGFDGENDDDD